MVSLQKSLLWCRWFRGSFISEKCCTHTQMHKKEPCFGQHLPLYRRYKGICSPSNESIEAVDRPFISLCNPRWWDPLSGHFPIPSSPTYAPSHKDVKNYIDGKIDGKELEVDFSFLIAGFLIVHSWAWYRVGPWLLLYISCSWRRPQLVPPIYDVLTSSGE